MHDTRPDPERAYLVQVVTNRADPEQALRLLAELGRLAHSANLVVAGERVVSCSRLTSATYLTKGQMEEVGSQAREAGAQLVIFNHPLSPIQQRNLERNWHLKVVDRTGLILAIFADRARTSEGRLQVELASLLYQKSRMVRSWTHLERQRGGVGLRGGPGEAQIEIDRRLIRERIGLLQQQLRRVAATRRLQRRVRQDVPMFMAALVGYTNAGKSTLFNRLTRAQVVAEDRLFATLDPTLRTVPLPDGTSMVLSDTVGFIRDLPHSLVMAFQATLEEVREADLLIQVVDCSDPEWSEQMVAVDEVLRGLAVSDKPMLVVYNKIDCLPSDHPRPWSGSSGLPSLAVSAVTGEGVDGLVAWLQTEVTRCWPVFQLVLGPEQGRLRARLFQEGRILHQQETEGDLHLTVALPPAVAGRLRAELQPLLVV